MAKQINKVERYDWSEIAGKIGGKYLVKTCLLNVDQAYQRERLSESKVLRLARDFTWPAFGLAVVGKREDKTFWVVDGQHRVEAAKRRHIAMVPCYVFASRGPSHEADVFLKINCSRVGVGAVNKYNAGVTTGNETHAGCNAMLDELGLSVSRHEGCNQICFAGELIKTYSANAEMCKRALLTQRKMIGGDQSMDNRIHKGLFYLLTRNTTRSICDRAEWVFENGGKPALLNSICRHRLMVNRGAFSPRTCAMGILDFSNNKLRNKIQLEE